jgi:hypothetical protein
MLTKIRETLHIRCPYGRAKDFLKEELGPIAGSHKYEVRTLRVPYRDREITAPVVMNYCVAHDPMGFDEPWKIDWSPEDNSLYPSFTGLLCVRADENWDTAVLELSGEYEPPLGIAGAAFDAVIGKRIAEVTAITFLGEIAQGMEKRYEAQEIAKAALRP